MEAYWTKVSLFDISFFAFVLCQTIVVLLYYITLFSFNLITMLGFSNQTNILIIFCEKPR